MKRVYLVLVAVFSVIAFTSCEEYLQKKKTLSEYASVLEKVQEAEKLLVVADFNKMKATDLAAIRTLGEELYYDFNPMGLEPDQIAACESLKQRVKELKVSLVKKAEGMVSTFKITPYEQNDVLMEKKTSYPIYLKKGETLRWKINAQKPLNVKLCNADSRSVLKSYSGKVFVKDTLVIQNSAIYFIEVNPNGAQYVDFDINYKVVDFERMFQITPVKTERVECSKGDFGAEAIRTVKMQNLFESPRKFTLRGQLKAAFSGSSDALVPVLAPAGATDILYSMRLSTSEQDHSSDGEFYDDMTRTYKQVKFLGLPLYEKSSSNGLFNTLLDDNRPLREEDAYCDLYVFRSQSEAKRFQGGAEVSKLKYDVDYSIVGSQSCNGRIPLNGATKIYLGFRNVRVRYTNYLWVEAVAAVPVTEYYKTKYSL